MKVVQETLIARKREKQNFTKQIAFFACSLYFSRAYQVSGRHFYALFPFSFLSKMDNMGTRDLLWKK